MDADDHSTQYELRTRVQQLLSQQMAMTRLIERMLQYLPQEAQDELAVDMQMLRMAAVGMATRPVQAQAAED